LVIELPIGSYVPTFQEAAASRFQNVLSGGVADVLPLLESAGAVEGFEETVFKLTAGSVESG
jgi:hypothetical protein